ncbi:MAG: radical SAM protein, partial [Acidobacteriota bacterium]
MSLPQLEPATSKLDLDATDVGSVFVSNYPPYGVWGEAAVPRALEVLDSPGDPEASLGLYMHVPFCRRRCKFCYFRVFTDKKPEQISAYADHLAGEVEEYSRRKIVEGRDLDFVYVGGGTPSYLPDELIESLFVRVKAAMSWDKVEEVAFECEPGTLTEPKLETLRNVGVTRLSVGIENFDDRILRLNGRAHLSPEIERVQPWIAALDFPQVNVDLIAGMVGETWESWRETVQKTIDWDPDSVTLYQMELPFNTVFSKAKMRGESEVEFADWAMKREWH